MFLPTFMNAMTNPNASSNFKNKKSAINNFTNLVSLDNLIHCVGEAVIITDTTGRVRFLNDAAEDIIGQTKQNIVNQLLLDYVTLFDEIKYQPVDSLNQCLSNNKTVVLSSCYSLIRLDGKQVPIQGSIASLHKLNTARCDCCSALRHSKKSVETLF